MELEDFPSGPFGQPDGAMADITRVREDAISMPSEYGAVARSPEDVRIRVVVGARGSGKSFFLARMRDLRSQDRSSHASRIQRNEDLLTRLVVDFARRMQIKGGDTELWTLLWRRSILLSTWSFLRSIPEMRPSAREPSDQARWEAFDKLDRQYSHLLGSPSTPRRVSSRAARIIQDHPTYPEMQRYLGSDDWEDVESLLAAVLHDSPELFLFVDDIDRNYAWAPTLWSQCQRGLFYTVMEFLREDVFRSKLHVVVALRDVTLASIAGGEHSTRYIEHTHILQLEWSRRSIRFLLEQMLRHLPAEYFASPQRDVAAWIGLPTVLPARPHRGPEPTIDYLLRHTRMLPRDIVVLGNALCAFIHAHGHGALNQGELRRIVSDTSRKILRSELAACLNERRYSGQSPVQDNYDDSVLEQPVSPTVRDQVDLLIDAIRQMGVERFDRQLLEVFELVTSEFDGGVQLTNVLWQHRLLCWIAKDGRAQFFDPDDYVGRLTLPRDGDVLAYQWHCMVHDLAPNLEVNAPSPASPP